MTPPTTENLDPPFQQRRRIAIVGLAAVTSITMLFSSVAASGQESPPATPGAAPSQPAPPPAPPVASPPTETAPPATDAEYRPRRPWFGGIGYATVGPYLGDLSGLQDALRAPTALGASYDVGRAGIMLGGGGGAVLFGHLWIGGKGYGLLTGPFENLRGKASLNGGGGGFELGYVASRGRMLFIPFMGVGGFAYNLEVTNNTAGPMPIQQLLVIPAGQSRTFTAGFATLDIGIRVQRLLFFCNSGLTAGFEVGLLRSLSTRPWQSEAVEFSDHPGAALDGAYVRVNFGGGGFSYR